MPFSIPFDCSYYDTIIFVYGGFADAELFRCGADCGSVFNDVQGQLHGPLLDIGFHIYHSKTYF